MSIYVSDQDAGTIDTPNTGDSELFYNDALQAWQYKTSTQTLTFATGVTREEVEDLLANSFQDSSSIVWTYDDGANAFIAEIEPTILNDINNGLSVGDNVSELVNDAGYVTGLTNVSTFPNDAGYLTEATHDSLPQDNPHNVTKAQVGLSNVDNTSDANKPISTATQTALNGKYDATNPSGFETPAQLTARDTANRNRANHTGTQLSTTISDFNTAVLNALEHEDFENDVDLSYTTNTPFNARSFTTQSKPIGRYKVQIKVFFKPAATNNDDIFQLRIDGTQLNEQYRREGKDTGADQRDVRTLWGYYDNPSVGSFDIELWAGQGGGGTTTIHWVLAEVRRVA